MESLNYLSNWFTNHPIITNIIKYLVWLVFVILIIQFCRKYLKKRLPRASIRYKAQKGVEIFRYLFIIILTISYFTGNIKDFTLALGLFSAGIAITFQELFLSLAGSIYFS